MGVSTLHAIARERKAYVEVESTFGTIVQPTAGGAFRTLALNCGSGEIARIDRMDNRSTRDLLERIEGNRAPVEWSIDKYLIPSGTAGTPPDDHLLWKAAFGTYANVGATSDTYTPTDTQGAQDSLTLVDQLSQVHSEHLAGAVVQQWKLSGSGGEPPKVGFSGIAKKHLLTGRSNLTAAFSSSTCTVGDPSMFKVGSLVAVYQSDGVTSRDTNTGAGFPVVTITGSDVVVTGSPASTQIGDILVPFTPTPTVAGSPTPGINFSCTLGGTAVRLTQYEITLDNAHNPHSDEAGNQEFADYDEGYRKVSGKLTFRARQDWVKFLAERPEFNTVAIVLTLGTGAGKILTVTMSYCEYQYAQISKPEQGVAMFELPFVAKGSSGADSISAVFT